MKLNNKIFCTFLFLSIFFSLFLNISKVSAQVTSEYTQNTNDIQIVPDCSTRISSDFKKARLQALQNGLQNSGTAGGGSVIVKNDIAQECGWEDFLQLVKNIMTFMFYISAFLFTLSVVYAGFLYTTAFGEMGKVEQAHGIFSKAIIGMIFVFLAWLIVATILSTLGVRNAFSLINFSSVPVLNLTQQ